MLLLNFSHPLTPSQLTQVEAITHQPVEQVFNLPVSFDNAAPFLPQFAALMDTLPLTPDQLQTEPLLVNPPSLNFIAVLLLAELHGRMGYFPPMLRLRPIPDSLPPRYEVAEILNLQAVRDSARKTRY
ncbi:MAG TPA: CRISPR-associated protein Csx15 [Anaerolineaceae bacterium]